MSSHLRGEETTSVWVWWVEGWHGSWLHRGYIGIMEKNMEATLLCGCIGVLWFFRDNGFSI